MIVCHMELKSAISESRDTRLCTVKIANDGTGTGSRGNYDVTLYARGNGRVVRRARVENYARNSKPAWRLLQAAIEALNT